MNSEFEDLTTEAAFSSTELHDSEVDELTDEYGDLPFEEVEVATSKADGRQRQISAKIQIPYAIEQVWQILTDYDRLAEFIPNLTKSQRIEHPQGGIRIEQVGTESLLKLKFCARVVLDMVEHFPHRLDFNMVEGDFKTFTGSWTLQPASPDGTATELCYTVSILPPRMMPVGMIERRLQRGLVLNLSAIRQQADVLFDHPS
ncbi:SRPBCC family protein [Egbenema bharatensis]|uniref:SRPBCC family protein n=1 Tax=Egbenema bharatensis TaxID=3463334 RepID=UPI003A89CF0F